LRLGDERLKPSTRDEHAPPESDMRDQRPARGRIPLVQVLPHRAFSNPKYRRDLCD
jgi:hypothetical protein